MPYTKNKAMCRKKGGTRKVKRGGFLSVPSQLSYMFSKPVTNIEEIVDNNPNNFSQSKTPRLWTVSQAMNSHGAFAAAYEYYFDNLDVEKCKRLNKIRLKWIAYKTSPENIPDPSDASKTLTTHKIQKGILPSLNSNTTRYVSFLMREYCIEIQDNASPQCVNALTWDQSSDIADATEATATSGGRRKKRSNKKKTKNGKKVRKTKKGKKARKVRKTKKAGKRKARKSK